MSQEDYKLFIKNYEEGKNVISMNLAKAREILLMQVNYIPAIFFHFIIYGLTLLCCIYSFFVLKWFGLLYSIVFVALWFSYMGICSLSKEESKGNTIVIVGIVITILFLLLFDFNISLLIVLSFLDLYLTYYLYQFSAKVLINNFILKDINCFNLWYNDLFSIKDQD